ncbi:D-alanine--D-alanine ligase A [Candidatus Falkowbacteria bacterium RIFOXYB2_FULL_38_15]|uniref:D-alanine--D-alanine ligase n=1 Tax=Candidatus Falkowbacteria bacterium RIFOXYA2_FULL_38_12 TaxID=1797993 RepID=A0A1F5S3S4_9BACT|nr:MAG: D-alanine--D-alanine ligase A [Candidatus Falkowbacteria bacterium RIFOXYA2_FULL_38_12]OGF33746.1 MAG: D-alanine--D-alanine ligase A [Candidatus Falkowbacteria bacterium RIFOXYB2_FULL_38_15]OGF42384.1 MAG: D-alanine--D-alanine ligase A [Candidatus Falkowbacteria bacterium RIFOXYD2_FULL_39_16]
MAKKINIGVIFGGKSGEHEVSLVSATSIIEALDKKKYNVVPVGITKTGDWLATGDPIKALKSGKIKYAKKAEVLIPARQGNFLQVGKKKIKIDIVFPVLHGTYGEDGSIQGLFEMAGIPYVGAEVLGSAIGMDKVVQKELYKNIGLNVSKYIWFFKNDWEKKGESENILRHIEKDIDYPCFVKPTNLGSSVGISKAKNKNELIKAINLAAKYDEKILAEEAVLNAREIECAVLGNENFKASIPGEVIPSGDFYDYNAKYVDGESEIVIPAKLSADVSKKVQESAIKAFEAINCKGMGRVDFLIDNKSEKIYINEINTIPGFTSISMYPKLWEQGGLSYPALLDELINLAILRFKEKQNRLSSYEPDESWYK